MITQVLTINSGYQTVIVKFISGEIGLFWIHGNRYLTKEELEVGEWEDAVEEFKNDLNKTYRKLK